MLAGMAQLGHQRPRLPEVRASPVKGEEYLFCKQCPVEWDVSPEDPDSTLGDALGHVDRRHPESEPINTIGQGVRP
jgi:hypothetical protein